MISSSPRPPKTTPRRLKKLKLPWQNGSAWIAPRTWFSLTSKRLEFAVGLLLSTRVVIKWPAGCPVAKAKMLASFTLFFATTTGSSVPSMMYAPPFFTSRTIRPTPVFVPSKIIRPSRVPARAVAPLAPRSVVAVRLIPATRDLFPTITCVLRASELLNRSNTNVGTLPETGPFMITYTSVPAVVLVLVKLTVRSPAIWKITSEPAEPSVSTVTTKRRTAPPSKTRSWSAASFKIKVIVCPFCAQRRSCEPGAVSLPTTTGLDASVTTTFVVNA